MASLTWSAAGPVPVMNWSAQDLVGLVFGHHDPQGDDGLFFGAAHGQDAVRRRGLDRFLPVEIVFVVGPLLLFAAADLGAEDALGEEEFADLGAGLGVFVDPLGDDVAGAGQGLGHGVDLFFLVDERGGGLVHILDLLFEDQVGQRLQALFLGLGGAGAALGPVGQVDVFQHGHGLGGQDLIFKLVGEFAQFFQRGQDGGAAFVQFAQLVDAVADGGDGHLVQAAGGLFAVAGDERDGGAFIKQFDGGAHAGRGDLEFLGNLIYVGLVHRGSGGWSRPRRRDGLARPVRGGPRRLSLLS